MKYTGWHNVNQFAVISPVVDKQQQQNKKVQDMTKRVKWYNEVPQLVER